MMPGHSPAHGFFLPTALIVVAMVCFTAATAQARAGEPEPENNQQWSTISFVSPRSESVTLKVPSPSRSVGLPSDGTLVNPRCIGAEGPGFVHSGEASCGTDELVMVLLFAVSEMLRDYPNSTGVVIGNISLPGGGPLKPHKSHMSGRDVDIGFYAKDNERLSSFADLDPTRIDFDKTLTLLVNLISTGSVQFIFINYALQPYFVEAAKRLGYDDQQLEYLFQYPRGKNAQAGVIRHSNGHLRHAHVRFKCSESDHECLDRRPTPAQDDLPAPEQAR